jgi:hypothetical protein
MEKTIDDLTRQDIADLVEASIGLLQMTQMMFWVTGTDLDEEKSDDKSFSKAMDRMRTVLAQIGLPQPSYSEFAVNLRRVLSQRPEDFTAAQLDAMRKEDPQ